MMLVDNSQKMKVYIQVVLFGLIALHAVLGAPHKKLYKRSISNSLPPTFTKDPWLLPRLGVLVSERSPVYIAKRGADGRVEFQEVRNAIKMVNELMLTRDEYREAYAENVNNPDNDSTESQKGETSLPESGTRPKILYPEIMVAVSHDFYEKFDKDMWTMIPYLLAFWNGVDMMYRSIENPQIRLHVRSIIFEDEPGVLEFLVPHPVDGNTTLKHDVLTRANKFWFEQKDQLPLDSYDEVVTMITKNICLTSEGECGGTAIGQSWLGTVCSYNDKKIEKVAILGDNGKFGGIPTAAHEFGHSLGINHDTLSYILEGELDDKPGCNQTNEGFIMAAYTHTYYFKRRWSPCSMDWLDGFLKKRNATCLLNTPPIAESHIPRLLPGKLASADDQCKAHGFKKACIYDEDVGAPCEKLTCEDDYCHTTSEVAAEGTPCDDNDPTKFCMFGECISGSKFV